MEEKKKLRLFDSVLLAVTVVLVVESVAPAAAVGPSQFFWWILLLLTFFLPYGMISAELGTTYEDEGGIYDWVKKAFGPRHGGRVAWYYWINFPIWMGSLAVLIPTTIMQIFPMEFGVAGSAIISLVFIWVITVISLFRISESQWILNLAAIFKVIIMVSLGGIGIYYAIQNGPANDLTFKALLPTFDVNSLSFISVIIFNFLGFEVVASMAGEMDNPQRDIPKANIMGGALIAVFYLLAAFGVSVAIPFEKLTADTGLLESFTILLGGKAIWFVTLIGLMFLFTLAANLISWAYGVNYVALYAAENHSLPALFKWKSKKNDMPVGAPLLNGVIASILVLIVPLMNRFGMEDVFWSFFALNLLALLTSYIYMFPAFLKLRKIDPDRPRPYRVHAEGVWLKVIAIVPFIMLVASVIFTVVPLNFSEAELSAKIPLMIGALVTAGIGEIVVHNSLKKYEKESIKHENTAKQS